MNSYIDGCVFLDVQNKCNRDLIKEMYYLSRNVQYTYLGEIQIPRSFGS